MIDKSYLGRSEKLWVRFPEARRREHPLLRDAHGIIFEVFETEVDGRFLLIVDYRYIVGRPDSARFLQEPWLEVPALGLNQDAPQHSIEVMQCDTISERDEAFGRLIQLLETNPGWERGFGAGR